MPFSWLGYFIAGVSLSRTNLSLSKLHVRLVWVFAYIVLAGHAYYLFSRTGDLFVADRQTKWTVIPYSLASFWFIHSLLPLLRGFKILPFIGLMSFIIFLAHTLVLRFIQQPLSLPQTSLFVGTYLLMLFVSIRIFTSYPLIIKREVPK